jgi:hypothetical protein
LAGAADETNATYGCFITYAVNLSMVIPRDLVWPDPDPNVFECDAYHPPDMQRPIFMGHAAGPTHCRVQWRVFDPSTPPGNASEETWASVNEAYEGLPHPLAVETIILAHVGLAHWIVESMADSYYPDAMRLERRERRGGKGPKPCASIAEDWFSMVLLKMLRVVVGDRKRKSKSESKTQGLRYYGEKNGWDDPQVNAPRQIAKYFGKVIWTEIQQSYNKEEAARRHIIAYLLTRQSYRMGARVKQREIDQEEQVSCESGPCVAYQEETPERFAAVNEALNRALAECAKARALAECAQGCVLDDGERDRVLADCDTFDIRTRLLLAMKRENVLTEEEMGEQVGLGRDEVQRRLQDIRRSMETDLELPHNGQSKRAAKKPLPVLSVTEALLDSPDGDLFDRLLTQVRKGLLAEVQMAARLGWTRDQLQRRLHAMHETNGRCPGKRDLLDALIGVAD